MDNYEPYLVDWTGLPSILDIKIFETSNELDALNRVMKITLPENIVNERKEIIPSYNHAGALEKVHYDGIEYVENIAYNAKGQRLLIAFGNGIMTRYLYDSFTSRLMRQRSERYVKTQIGNTITYTPQSGTNKQDDKYIYDLIGNILNIQLSSPACGIGGTDNLNREFEYDPLYRLLSATGRENVQGGNYHFPGWNDFVRSSDSSTTQAYTRKYVYDKVGNVQQIKQLGTSRFTRDFSYVSGKNKLQNVEIGANGYSYSYDTVGNQLIENTERHFEWDTANRLLLFKNQTGSAEPSVIAQYLYDSSGNRVKKIIRKQGGDFEIRTYIDGIFEHFTDEVDEQNIVHIMDDQSRIANIRIGDDMGDPTPAVKYNIENNIYSSTVILDSFGSVVNIQEYYPFGETSFGSYSKKRYQYVGKERDEESGLYYYGARYYSPWIARFISCDPLSAKYAQLSPYNYSDNNPINDYDIDGMQNNNTEPSSGGNNPEKIPAGTSSSYSSNTVDTPLNRTTTITGVKTEKTFNLKTETFTVAHTVTNTILSTDKLTGKNNFSSSSYSSSETISYKDATGKDFNPYELEIEGYKNSEQYQKDDLIMRWNVEQRLKVQASQYGKPSSRTFGPVTREGLDNSVMGFLPWYNIARGIQDVQEGNNWGWLKIALEIIPLEILPPIVRRFVPGLAYTSKAFGYDSYLFGIGRNGFQKGVLNSGVLRMGWGFEAATRSHVLRIGIGHNPRFHPATRMFGLNFHYHINVMKTPARF